MKTKEEKIKEAWEAWEDYEKARILLEKSLRKRLKEIENEKIEDGK